MQGTGQWKVESGFIIASEYNYDISVSRLSDPHLMDHMAEKTWVDMDQLRAAIELAKHVTSFNAADDDEYSIGED